MERTDAKELLHIKAWLERAAEIVARGKDASEPEPIARPARPGQARSGQALTPESPPHHTQRPRRTLLPS